LGIGGIVFSLNDICLGEGSGASFMASVREREKGMSREECEECEASILTSVLFYLVDIKTTWYRRARCISDVDI